MAIGTTISFRLYFMMGGGCILVGRSCYSGETRLQAQALRLTRADADAEGAPTALAGDLKNSMIHNLSRARVRTRSWLATASQSRAKLGFAPVINMSKLFQLIAVSLLAGASASRHLILPEETGRIHSVAKSQIPKLVHMTLMNSSHVSCEDVALVQRWIDMNPDYDLRVSDDMSMRELVVKHFPKHLDLYDGLIWGVERADMWRYMVVQTYGGIYADMDVESLMPLSSWTGDEALAKYNQWTFAATPGHPVTLKAVENVQKWINNALFESVRTNSVADYSRTIIQRTGPMAWSNAIADYLVEHGPLKQALLLQGHLKQASDLEASPEEPWHMGDVLVLPWKHLSSFSSKAMSMEISCSAPYTPDPLAPYRSAVVPQTPQTPLPHTDQL
eukprot:gene1653-33047_t